MPAQIGVQNRHERPKPFNGATNVIKRIKTTLKKREETAMFKLRSPWPCRSFRQSGKFPGVYILPSGFLLPWYSWTFSDARIERCYSRDRLKETPGSFRERSPSTVQHRKMLGPLLRRNGMRERERAGTSGRTRLAAAGHLKLRAGQPFPKSAASSDERPLAAW